MMVQVQAQVVLRAYDMQGDMLEHIGMGQPFTLEVAVDGVGTLDAPPVIKGLEKMYVRDNGMMSMNINGKASIKYTYKVRIDTTGVYTIGPAVISSNNQTSSSNSVTVKVIEQSVAAQPSDKKQGKHGKLPGYICP